METLEKTRSETCLAETDPHTRNKQSIAALRASKTDDNLLLLKTHMGAGHGGKSGRYGRLEDTAWVFGFVLDQLGVHAG